MDQGALALAPGDRRRNRRFGYPVLIVGTEWRRGRRVVWFLTTSNRALWRMGLEEFLTRFAAEAT